MSWTSGDTPSFAGSPLLRESPPFHSHTGPGGADLSLSELYISDRSGDGSASKPFSLLPQRDEDVPGLENEGDPALFDADGQLDDAEEEDPTVMDKRKRPLHETRTREERLQHDLFVLRKLNMSFSLYNDALKDTRSSTENVALQLDRTDRLLDQYVNLLKHTEKNAKLILDKTWEGGASDQARLEQLRVEAAQKAKREREERERATQLEQERLEKEERERKAKEDKDARDRDKRKPISVRGVRGRGTGRVMTTGTRGRIASDYANTTMRGASDTSGRGSTVSRGVRRT